METNFAQYIKKGFSDIFYIWKDEIRNVFHDTGAIIFFIVVPLIYPMIYAFIYNNEVVREMPIVAIDNNRSAVSREFLRKVDATPDVKIISYCSNMNEAKMLMYKKKAYGIVNIPKDFSKDIATGRQTEVNVVCDMSSLLYYKNLLLSTTEVSLDMNNKIKVCEAGNTTDREDELTKHPIAYESVTLFNPTNGFATFIIPAVIMLVVQQISLLAIGLLAGTARAGNKYRDVVPVNNHYNGALRIVLGKSLSYFMVLAVMVMYMAFAIPRFFKLTQIGHAGDLLLFLLPYVLACISFAMAASIFVKSRERVMLLFVFTSLPLLFISGISWPGSAVPAFWHYVSYLFPSTFGINGFVSINTMGATLNEVMFEYKALWLQAGLYFLLASVFYSIQLNTSYKHRFETFEKLSKFKPSNLKKMITR